MSVRSLNWLKFGGLVGLAFALGLMFAGLLDLPTASLAQHRPKKPEAAQALPASNAQARPVSSSSPAVASLVSLSDAFAEVADQVRPSVVYIRARRTERELTQQQRLPRGLEEFFGNPRRRGNSAQPNDPQIETGSGSGFIVSDQGYILTNNHVVDGADEVTVRLLDRHEFKAKVIGTDPNTDVAVIKIEPRNGVRLAAASLGSSNAARVGEWVLAVGNPLSENLSFTVTSGIISAKGRGQLPLPNRSNLSIQDFIQTDAAINRGNSGGPLLNVRGEVVGINSAIYSPTGVSAGYAFAIPIDLARQVMDQLISKGKVERAALGVSVNDANANDAEAVGLDEIYGVRLEAFSSEDSPAKSAGLQPGDIIVTIDGQKVEYVAQLQQLVAFRRPGETVKVEVARNNGVRKTYNVRLQAQQPATQTAQNEGGAEPENSESTENASLVRERLGVSVTAVNAQVIDELDLPASTRGVVIQSVDPYGPADGLLTPPSQFGVEIITGYDGKPVRNEADLRAAIRATKPGAIVSLAIAVAGENIQTPTRVVRVKVK